jgi:hypothetical protein
MMQRKEIIKNVLIIFCVFILLIIPWASVFGVQDPGLVGASREFQHIAFFVIITALVLQLIYRIYNKPLKQEMKEEEIREADQKDEKQLLFKPTIGFSVMFLFFISIPVFAIIFQFRDHKVNFGFIIALIGVMGLLIWLWYKMPVFTFTEDSVQIKSHLVYLFGIDRKTVFRYADITSVRPDAEAEGKLNMYGYDRRHRIMISTNGATQVYVLVCYNPDIIAKIYLRFREKLGDKVTLQ